MHQIIKLLILHIKTMQALYFPDSRGVYHSEHLPGFCAPPGMFSGYIPEPNLKDVSTDNVHTSHNNTLDTIMHHYYQHYIFHVEYILSQKPLYYSMNLWDCVKRFGISLIFSWI